MTGKPDVFKTINLSNPGIMFTGIITAIISIMGISFMFILNDFWPTVVLIFPTLFLPIFVTLAWTSKIIVGLDYIERKSFFWSKRILFEEVKLFGVYQQGLYSLPKLMDNESIENTDSGVIFLSTNEEFDLDNNKPKSHLRFPYRKELYKRIEEVL